MTELLPVGTRVKFISSPTVGNALVGHEGIIIAVRPSDKYREYSSYDVHVDDREVFTFSHRVVAVKPKPAPWAGFHYHVHRDGVDNPVAGFDIIGDALEYIRRGSNTREYSIKTGQ
jgi:hypothetical protein